MLRKRLINLIYYALITIILLSNVFSYYTLTTYAMVPGTLVKDLVLEADTTNIIDTRYIYRISKEDFVAYFKDSDFHYNSVVSDMSSIDFSATWSYEISTYPSKWSNDRVVATEDTNGYLLFDFYSVLGAAVIYLGIPYRDTSPVTEVFCDTSRNCLGLISYIAERGNYYFDSTLTNVNNDFDFQYVGKINTGFVAQPNVGYVIAHNDDYGNYDSISDLSIVLNQHTDVDVSNYCDYSFGLGSTGISDYSVTSYFYFDDTYPNYTLLSDNFDGDFELVFGVDLPSNNYIIYADYITGECLKIDWLQDSNTPVLWEDTSGAYVAYFNEEGVPVTQDMLHTGMVVYCIPKNVTTTMYDILNSYYKYDASYSLTVDSDLTNLDKISYGLNRPLNYPEEDYLVISLKDNLYRGNVFAKELRLVSKETVTFPAFKEATLYSGYNNTVIQTYDTLKWKLKEINSLDINEYRSYGKFSTNNVVYDLYMSSEDKANYTAVWTYNYAYAAFECTTNPIQTLASIKNSSKYSEIYAGTTVYTEATCMSEGSLTSTVNYDYGWTDFTLRDPNLDFINTSSSNLSLWSTFVSEPSVAFMQDNVSTVITLEGNDSDSNIIINLKPITTFDEFCNPTLLEKYGVKRYEGFVISHFYSSNLSKMFVAFIPTRNDSGGVDYLVCYDRYFGSYSYPSNGWPTIKRFSCNDEGVAAYNEWLTELSITRPGVRGGVFSANDVCLLNYDVVDTTYLDATTKDLCNNAMFVLGDSADNVNTFTSVFSSEDSPVNISLVVLSDSAPYTTVETIKPLGHDFSEGQEFLIDLNDPMTYNRVSNLNPNVVDKDTLIAYATNSIDVNLLDDPNNKLYGNLCKRNDAYTLNTKHTHDYSYPVFNWSSDYSTCTATVTCTSGDSTETLDCAVVKDSTKSTCTIDGSDVYTALVVFNGTEYADTITVPVTASGHTYSEPKFTWSEDLESCYVTFTCTSGDDTQVKDCVVSCEETPAKCIEKGSKVYTAVVEFDNKTYKDTKDVDIPALGHEYGEWKISVEPTYTAPGEERRDCIREDDFETREVAMLTDLKVTYDANGGTSNRESDIKVYKQPYGELAAPSRTGYTFVNWMYEDKIVLSTSIVEVPGDHTLKSDWRENCYKLTFDANGGEGDIPSLTLKYTENKKLPDNVLTRSGYKFLGWSLDKEASKATYKDGASVTKLSEADNSVVTLFAVWNKVEPKPAKEEDKDDEDDDYVIEKVKVVPTSSTPTSQPKVTNAYENVKTQDSMLLVKYVVLFVLGLCVTLVSLILYKRSKKSESAE